MASPKAFRKNLKNSIKGIEQAFDEHSQKAAQLLEEIEALSSKAEEKLNKK